MIAWRIAACAVWSLSATLHAPAASFAALAYRDRPIAQPPLTRSELRAITGRYQVQIGRQRMRFALVTRRDTLWLHPERLVPTVLTLSSRQSLPAPLARGCREHGTRLEWVTDASADFRLTLDMTCRQVVRGWLSDDAGRHRVTRVAAPPRSPSPHASA